MSEIFLFILAIFLTGIIVLQEYCYQRQASELMSNFLRHLKEANVGFEREKSNLIMALKSHTADEFTSNMILPPQEKKEEEKPDDVQDLFEFAEENPEEFDKKVLDNKS